MFQGRGTCHFLGVNFSEKAELSVSVFEICADYGYHF